MVETHDGGAAPVAELALALEVRAVDGRFAVRVRVVRADEEAALLANGATLPQVPTIQKVVADAAQDYETAGSLN